MTMKIGSNTAPVRPTPSREVLTPTTAPAVPVAAPATPATAKPKTDVADGVGAVLARPSTTSFAATSGGRGVGGTLALLRPQASTIGRATIVPMNELIELCKSGAPPPSGLMVLDTNFGALEATAHPGWSSVVVDHHGPVHGADKGRGTNSTTQLVDRFEAALGADVGAAKKNPQFTAALVAVEKATKAHGLSATTTQKEQAAAGLLALNLTQLSSDNVGDGLSWPAWMANNQARVLLDPQLRTTIREATVHEDFGVFGGNYLDGVDDPSKLPASIKLQSALFLAYDEALARAGVRGTDRVAPEKAAAVAADVGKAIDEALSNPAHVEQRASAFFAQVGFALTTVADNALVKGPSVADKQGGWALPVFDTAKLPKELGTFASWAVPPLFGKHALQMTVSPGADGRSTMILAIPDGRTLPSGKGLLGLLSELNAREQARTPPGTTPTPWFGRDVVLLPAPPGSLLNAQDVCDVVRAAGLL